MHEIRRNERQREGRPAFGAVTAVSARAALDGHSRIPDRRHRLGGREVAGRIVAQSGEDRRNGELRCVAAVVRIGNRQQSCPAAESDRRAVFVGIERGVRIRPHARARRDGEAIRRRRDGDRPVRWMVTAAQHRSDARSLSGHVSLTFRRRAERVRWWASVHSLPSRVRHALHAPGRKGAHEREADYDGRGAPAGPNDAPWRAIAISYTSTQPPIIRSSV